MGMVPWPLHNPHLSYEENLRVLRAEFARRRRFRSVAFVVMAFATGLFTIAFLFH